MGKKFGTSSIVLGIASIGLIVLLYPIGFFRWAPESYYFILIFIIFLIILAAIGIVKDDSRVAGIGGLILGIAAIILWIIFPILISS